MKEIEIDGKVVGTTRTIDVKKQVVFVSNGYPLTKYEMQNVIKQISEIENELYASKD